MLGPFQRRLKWGLTFLNESRDVFDHDDCVVNNEARRNRQRHQRQVVQAESHQIHEAKCADKRQGDSNAGDDGRCEIPEKQKHHHHHESDRKHQFELHVCGRSANRRSAVGQNREVHHRRQRGLELGQEGLDAIHDRNDVGSRLPLNVHNHCGLIIHPRGLFCILNVIDGNRDIGQPYGRPFPVCHNNFLIIAAREDLIVGPDGENLPVTLEVSFGLIDIGGSQRRPNVFKA